MQKKIQYISFLLLCNFTSVFSAQDLLCEASHRLPTTTKSIKKLQFYIPVIALQNIILEYLSDWHKITSTTAPSTYVWNCLAIRYDGQHIAVGLSGKKVQIFELKSGLFELIQEIEKERFEPICVTFSPKIMLLALASHRKIKLFRYENNRYELMQSMTTHFELVSITFSPDSTYLIAGSWDSTVTIFKLSNSMYKRKNDISKYCYLHRQFPVFSSDGNCLASSGWFDSQKISLWRRNGKKFESIKPFVLDSQPFFKKFGTVHFLSDEKEIVTSFGDWWHHGGGIFAIWDISEEAQKKTMHPKQVLIEKLPTSVAIARNGTYICATIFDTDKFHLYLWQLQNNKYVHIQKLPMVNGKVSNACCTSNADGTYLAAINGSEFSFWKNQALELQADGHLEQPNYLPKKNESCVIS